MHRRIGIRSQSMPTERDICRPFKIQHNTESGIKVGRLERCLNEVVPCLNWAALALCILLLVSFWFGVCLEWSLSYLFSSLLSYFCSACSINRSSSFLVRVKKKNWNKNFSVISCGVEVGNLLSLFAYSPLSYVIGISAQFAFCCNCSALMVRDPSSFILSLSPVSPFLLLPAHRLLSMVVVLEWLIVVWRENEKSNVKEISICCLFLSDSVCCYCDCHSLLTPHRWTVTTPYQ